MMVTILNSAIIGFCHFAQMMAVIMNSAKILDSAICTKRTSLIHSDSTWWWLAILNCLDSMPSWFSHFDSQKNFTLFILTQLDDGCHLEFCHVGFRHFAQKELHSFILKHLDDGSHLQFCHVGFTAISDSKTLSQIHSTLLLWVKLIPSD